MQPGDVLLGKFRVERLLGHGGMGQVVAVRHVKLDELFAMKLMHPEMLTNREAIERFVREARASARRKSEHVVRVHDVGELENGAPYMLMDHLVGDDLAALLDKRGTLPVHQVAQYVLQACEAIAEAHGQGIVHRDLKPANLFLTSRLNGTPCVKVLDFGISKKIDSAGQFTPRLTATGTIMGSPAYMPPEQMRNGKVVDARSDIWALGAILYELTTGALPFVGENMTELVARVLSDPATPPSVLLPELSPAFDTVVLTCLQKRPEHRYQSVNEFMEALRPFMTDDKSLQIKVPTTSGLPRVDDVVDSERPTRVVNRSPRVVETPRLPSAVDVESMTSTDPTIEMTTQIRRLGSEAQIAVTPPNLSSAPNASGRLRMIFLGIGVLSTLVIAALVVTQTTDSLPKDAGVTVQPPAVSAAPEIVSKPVDIQPPAASPSSSLAAASSAALGVHASNSATSSPATTTISRPGSTSKPFTPKTKPSLY